MARTRNRRIRSNMNSKGWGLRYLFIFVAVALIGVIVNIGFESTCNSLQGDVGKMENEIKREKAIYERDLQKWEHLKTPQKLSAALRRHGLNMKYASPDRVVHMSKDGKPDYKSIALARATSRISRTENTAAVSTHSTSRRNNRSRR